MNLSFPFALNVTFLLLVPLFFLFILKPFIDGARTTRTKLPPGPLKLPIIGNLFHMMGALPHHAFATLAKKYGPIIHLQIGENSTIIISSSRLAKEALMTNDLTLADKVTNRATNIMFYGSTDIAFSHYSNYWRQMRKICTLELLSATKFRSFESIRKEEMSSFIESIRASAGSAINIRKMIMLLQNMITCRATVGSGCFDHSALIDIASAVVAAAGGFDLADLFPSLKVLHFLGSASNVKKFHKRADKMLDGIISEHMQNLGDNSKVEDLLDVLLRLKESCTLEFPITFDNIKAIIMDMFAAGTDTSSMTIEWAMIEMLRKPSVMRKAQAEIRLALKGKKTINEVDIQNLSYLNLIIKETLQMHGPAPLLIPRKCREQCEIGGYTIPVNTHVIVNAWAIARDPEYWQDPESFEPERFENNSFQFNGANFEYLPFGAGRRICPGITFGIGNVQVTLATLLFHFDWKLPDGMKADDMDMTEVFGAAIKLKNYPYVVATPCSSL